MLSFMRKAVRKRLISRTNMNGDLSLVKCYGRTRPGIFIYVSILIKLIETSISTTFGDGYYSDSLKKVKEANNRYKCV